MWALPFLTALYPSAHYAPYVAAGRRHKPLVERARSLIGQAARWLPGRAPTVVADSGYAAIGLLAWCQRQPPSAPSQILTINPTGTVSLFAMLPTGSGPVGLAFDRLGNLYAAESSASQISRISADGQTVSFFAGVSAPGYLAFSIVPEPSTWALALLGGIVMVAACQG